MIHQDSVWLVTGCSRGLGREVARMIIDNGFRAVITARDVRTIEDLADGNERAWITALDVTNAAQVETAVKGALNYFGRIDVVVNNAGYSLLGATEEVSECEARAQFDTNYFGALRLIQAVLPIMRAQRSGHIVNLSSVAGFCALPGCGQYAASKFALEGMSEALVQEVSPLGIHVTVVEPHDMRTELLSRNARPMPERPPLTDYVQTSGAQIARLDRLHGRQSSDPARVADAILMAVDSSDPPFRLTLGSSGVTRVREKLREVQVELAKWEDISRSVNFNAPR